MDALEIRDLRKTYASGVVARQGIDLEVAEGDFFALLGPNGAGKSTLIGIVSSLVNATSGDARVFGISVREQRDRKSTRLNSSYVAISYAVFCLKKKRHEMYYVDV